MKQLGTPWKKANKLIGRLRTDQRGVTGLETAIILIAFVVVASVFAFTVLSTGIFSAERGKETIHAGLREARSSVEVKGSVVALGVADKTLSNADTAWTASSNVTATADTTDKKQGSGSADLEIVAAFGTGLAAYIDLSETVDLSGTDSIQLWVKSSVATASGAIELRLSDGAACTNILESIDLPVLVANAWKKATLSISDNTDMTAIKCVGLNVVTDNGLQTVNLDDIYGRGQATSVVITLTNALGGEPLDLTEPSDSDANGLVDTDSIHKLIVTYTDLNQRIGNIYWSKTFEGNNDGDELLEAGEKAELTITLKGLSNANPLVRSTEFDLEFRPEDGGVMVIQRTMPSRIDSVMSLN